MKNKILCRKCLNYLSPLTCPFVLLLNNGTYVGDGFEMTFMFIDYDISRVLLDINTWGHCGSLRLNREISDEMIIAVRNWLTSNGGDQFFIDVKNKRGRIDATWLEGGIPHVVHFNEGMQVRNFLRSTGLVDDWSCNELDEKWVEIVEKALKI